MEMDMSRYNVAIEDLYGLRDEHNRAVERITRLEIAVADLQERCPEPEPAHPEATRPAPTPEPQHPTQRIPGTGSALRSITLEMLGSEANEADVELFRELCREYMFRTGATEADAIDAIWGEGDFIKSAKHLLGEDAVNTIYEASGVETYHSIRLTEEQLTALDDPQEWWQPGDEVYLGGHVEQTDQGEYIGSLDLMVNEYTHDNWTRVEDLPAEIREALLR